MWGWYHWPKGQIYVQFVADGTPKDFFARAVLVQLAPVCLVAEGYFIPAAELYICSCGIYEVPVSNSSSLSRYFEKQLSSISTTLPWFGIVHRFAEGVLYSIIQVVIRDIKQYQPSIASGIPMVTKNQLDFVVQLWDQWSSHLSHHLLSM